MMRLIFSTSDAVAYACDYHADEHTLSQVLDLADMQEAEEDAPQDCIVCNDSELRESFSAATKQHLRASLAAAGVVAPVKSLIFTPQQCPTCSGDYTLAEHVGRPREVFGQTWNVIDLRHPILHCANEHTWDGVAVE